MRGKVIKKLRRTMLQLTGSEEWPSPPTQGLMVHRHKNGRTGEVRYHRDSRHRLYKRLKAGWKGLPRVAKAAMNSQSRGI